MITSLWRGCAHRPWVVAGRPVLTPASIQPCRGPRVCSVHRRIRSTEGQTSMAGICLRRGSRPPEAPFYGAVPPRLPTWCHPLPVKRRSRFDLRWNAPRKPWSLGGSARRRLMGRSKCSRLEMKVVDVAEDGRWPRGSAWTLGSKNEHRWTRKTKKSLHFPSTPSTECL